MKLCLVFLFLVFSSAAYSSTDSIVKGRAKLNLGGGYSVSGSEQSYSLGFAYRKFTSDILAVGGVASVSGVTGNVINGFVVGLGADYYVYKSDLGALFFGLEARYFKRSTELSTLGKVTVWKILAEAQLGYDFFIRENLAVTPVLFWSHVFDERESDNFRVNDTDGGLRLGLTFFF